MQASRYKRDENYGKAITSQGNEVCRDEVFLIVEVVVRRTMLILVLTMIGSVWMTPWERDRLLTKNSVHVNNYNIYKALDARARPFVESQCGTLQRRDECACK